MAPTISVKIPASVFQQISIQLDFLSVTTPSKEKPNCMKTGSAKANGREPLSSQL